MRTAAVALACLAVPLLGGACGPSFQALYEGDARFEHCYALDESGSKSMKEKSDCWREWTLHYTYGQTRDRVEYAAARYRALSRAPEAPTDEAMMEAAPGEGRGVSVAAPAPTSAFAPPPKTLAADLDAGAFRTGGGLPGYSDAAVVVQAQPETPEARPPGSECAESCDSTWTHCKDKCAGTPKACDACAAALKRCMRSCFR
jgi:hypothetical protein